MVCKKIGEINRFNERKDYTCEKYLGSEHQKKYNPEFNKDYFCKGCRLEDYKTEVIPGER